MLLFCEYIVKASKALPALYADSAILLFRVKCFTVYGRWRHTAAKGVTMKIADHNFVSQMKLGNEKALEYVMLHYGGLVKSVVHRYLYILPQYEEECISDVFLAAWNNASSYIPERNPFANWIAGIARIKALDYKRRYAARLLETSWEEAGNLPGKDDMEQISLIREEFSEETRQMLDCLKPEDRELFQRLYVDEESVEEVSARSGLSKAAIYNRLSRGRKKIRQLFPG